VLKVLSPGAIKSLYTHGARRPENISPDAWNMDLYFLSQPGVRQVQVELLYDYRRNFIRFERWLAYLREHQPHTLVPWGRNDPLFGTNGLDRLQRDLQDVEIHFLDTGHFALEEDWKQVADLITCFLVRLTKLPDRYTEYRQRCGLGM
jgi:pimeloyl-ACP methyl ester carboxylesterase